MAKKTKRMANGGLPTNAPARTPVTLTAVQKAALPNGLAKMAQLPAGLANRPNGMLPQGLQRRMPAATPAAAPAAPVTAKAGGMMPPGLARKAAAPAANASASTASNAAAGGGRGMGLPPGLAKRGPGNLPPGLAKMAQLPGGLRRTAASATAAKPEDNEGKGMGIGKPRNAMGALKSKMMAKRPGKTMKAGGLAKANGCAVRGKSRGKMV